MSRDASRSAAGDRFVTVESLRMRIRVQGTRSTLPAIVLETGAAANIARNPHQTNRAAGIDHTAAVGKPAQPFSRKPGLSRQRFLAPTAGGVIDPTQVGTVRFVLVGLVIMLLVIFRPQGILGSRREVMLSE